MGHLPSRPPGRIIFSAGFLCPNVWIEGMDLMTLHDKNDANIER
jgi:hypothetical protein